MKIIDFNKFSSIKIGGLKKVKILHELTKKPENHFIVGACNNLLISPDSPPFVMLGNEFDFIHLKGDELHVGGKTSGGKLLTFAKKENIANFELLYKLPGSVGGMIKMNAGLKEYEISNHLKRIKTYRGWIEKKDIKFSYRSSNIKDVIFEAVFDVKNTFDKEKMKYFKHLRINQPNNPSCGSCFKNPKGDFAARLIEAVGLKGFFIGDIGFSEKHANFLINKKNGTFFEAIKMINEAKKRVYEQFGMRLEEEIIIL